MNDRAYTSGVVALFNEVRLLQRSNRLQCHSRTSRLCDVDDDLRVLIVCHEPPDLEQDQVGLGIEVTQRRDWD